MTVVSTGSNDGRVRKKKYEFHFRKTSRQLNFTICCHPMASKFTELHSPRLLPCSRISRLKFMLLFPTLHSLIQISHFGGKFKTKLMVINPTSYAELPTELWQSTECHRGHLVQLHSEVRRGHQTAIIIPVIP